jgi:hypothetical protein
MAKPLGAKSIIIRDAIKAHPKKGNTEIAELINDSHDRMDDKIKVTPQDIAQQKQALKKAGGEAAAPTPAAKPAPSGQAKGKGGRPRKAATAAATPVPRAAVASAGPVDLIDKTLDLAQQAGGVAALKRLVDRLADMQRW